MALPHGARSQSVVVQLVHPGLDVGGAQLAQTPVTEGRQHVRPEDAAVPGSGGLLEVRQPLGPILRDLRQVDLAGPGIDVLSAMHGCQLLVEPLLCVDAALKALLALPAAGVAPPRLPAPVAGIPTDPSHGQSPTALRPTLGPVGSCRRRGKRRFGAAGASARGADPERIRTDRGRIGWSFSWRGTPTTAAAFCALRLALSTGGSRHRACQPRSRLYGRRRPSPVSS